MQTSCIPTDFKHALITPIFKSGTTDSPDNYRPISILPILSKILEKAIQKQLLEHLENHSLLSDRQFGYRQNRSIDLATALFSDRVRKNMDGGKLTGAVFVDLSKAFDTVGHSILPRSLFVVL